jgi:hypothetical protein
MSPFSAVAAGPVTPLVLLLLLAVACSDRGSTDRDRSEAAPTPSPTVTEVSGIPVLAGTTRGPGTPLRDGLEVAEGTVLLGTVFPTGAAVSINGVPVEDRGWRASLLVTGDPVEVMRAYLAQAADAGLGEFPDGAGSCKDDEKAYYRCEAWSGVWTAAEGGFFSAVLHRREAMGATAAVSHLLLTYRNAGRSTSPTTISFTESGAERPSGVPVPSRWEPLAGPGEPFGVGFAPTRPLTVEPGSLLVAPPGINLDLFDTYVAVLLVTGDPDEVMAAYADQVADLENVSNPPARVRFRRDDGAVVLSTFAEVAGGDSWSLEAVVREGEPTWVLVETTYD